MDIRFEVAQPQDDHAQLVMQWRNDPVTLAQSFNSEPKQWGGFQGEYRRYFDGAPLPPLFACDGAERVAFIRFRPFQSPVSHTRRACELSINVDPEQRGKGYGTAILAALPAFVQQYGFDDLVGEVKLDNTASHHAFRRAGYDCVASYRKQQHGSDVLLYAVRLRPGRRRQPVFVIAEAGSNWRMGTPARDRAMARALVDVAVEAGADAVKFQVYRPETIYVANAGESDYLAEAGIKEDITSIFEDLAMPYEMVPELADYCQSQGIEFMATPFSLEDFAVVDPHVKRHKIASYEISHLRLIEAAARSGKPLVLSTGASVEEDIAWAVRTFHEAGGRDLTLLQCTAKYPAPPESINLRVIPWLRERFGVPAGLSDHSRDPVRAPCGAVALGAQVIEKHYTLDNRLPGPDHSFALTPPELKAMVTGIRETEAMLGSGWKCVDEAEQELHSFARRGLQVLRDVAEGEALREDQNIGILRPGKQSLGVHPRHLAHIEGQKATRALRAGEGLQEGDWTAQ